MIPREKSVNPHAPAPARIALTCACVLGLAACAAPAAPAGQSSAPYPVTVVNCGQDVVVTAGPQRLVLLESAPVTILDGLGVLDRVVARGGDFPPEYYDPDLAARVEAIPALTDELDGTGHLMISAEAVIAQQPDLTFGLPENLSRAALLDAGSNTLVQPGWCPDGSGPASFESLYEQIRLYGEVFDRGAQAEQLVASLRDRVGRAEQAAGEPGRTAAVLYPSTGGGPLYAYGRASMAQPQLEAAGLENVFADSAERVFEVSVEELLGRDPDVLILLHQGSSDGMLEEVTGLPGADALTALRNDDVLVQLFNFTEPATPLTVTGLERIVERFGS